ncbi:MAG: cache domain-containing protein [Saprospiraceae bacterium]|nr:cache domain-containing protein [Saprospiraceae bacterium]
MPRISITVKNAIVYFFLLAFTSLVLGYSIYRISSNKILENATLSLNHNNESVVTQFNTFLEDIRRDIWFLSENPFLYAFLTNRNDQELKNNLSKELLSLLAIKKHYFQIRLIGLDQKGKEIIRAEKFIDSIGLVDNLHLQEKGERDYFRETIQLPKDSLYFSEINLNQEYGKIIMPMVPTMRVAKPIFQNDKIFGILIINIDLSYVFNELKK